MAVDAELLRYCWQEVVKHLWNLLRKKIKGCNIQMIAAYYWIDLVTSVMEKGDACIRKKKIPIRFMAKKPSDNDWNRLVDRVINVMPSKPPYLGRLSDAAIWPSWVATMIAPEGGLDRTLAERFLRNGDFKKQIANDREMIKQRRAKRLLGNSNPFVVEPETRLKNLRKIGANLSDWKKWLTDKKAEVHDHPFEKHSSFIEALKYAEGEYLRMHQMLTGSLPQGVTDQQG
jgi:hypothetical protein